ncbi:MAG: helix-turn-helix domain-containing protein [Firmicutes bacterium]|nr:helix-turn-helix domain-containing protein [Bacillota bacterium]
MGLKATDERWSRRLEEIARGVRRAVRPEEFAIMTGQGRSAVYDQIRQGRIRAARVGRRYLIPVSEVDRYLAEAITGATSNSERN